MGFSQGASLAATYMVRKAQQDPAALSHVFKCAVFLCGTDAWDVRGEGAVLKASSVGELIHIPTAHIVGSKDQHYEASLRLSELCGRGSRVVFDHGGGHEVPRDNKITEAMVYVIKDVIDKAHLTQ
jgi:predicted esterase